MSSPRAATSVATSSRILPGAEVGQGADALRLALVAVDRRGGDAVAVELLDELVGAVLGAGEDERLVDLAVADELHQQLALALAVDGMDDLLDQVDRRVARGDLDRCGTVEHALGERPDLVGEGRREEQVLALGGEQADHLADVADEAHVEHAVRLVEDEDLDLAQVDGALAGVVEQAAGGRDHDVDAASQGGVLAVEADAAVDGGRPGAGRSRRRAPTPRPGSPAHASGRGPGRGCWGAARGARRAARWRRGAAASAARRRPSCRCRSGRRRAGRGRQGRAESPRAGRGWARCSPGGRQRKAGRASARAQRRSRMEAPEGALPREMRGPVRADKDRIGTGMKPRRGPERQSNTFSKWYHTD